MKRYFSGAREFEGWIAIRYSYYGHSAFGSGHHLLMGCTRVVNGSSLFRVGKFGDKGIHIYEVIDLAKTVFSVILKSAQSKTPP
jgi:hypothetical protein